MPRPVATLPTTTQTTPTQGRHAQRTRTHRRKHRIAGVAFALPALVLFAAFAIYPMLRVFQLSFFDYNLTSDPEWVGLENYVFLAGDAQFHDSVWASLFYVVAAYLPTLLLAFLLALGLNSRMRGSWVVRLLYFAPVAMSWVAVSVIWRLVLHPDGLLNQTFDLEINWLTSSVFAKWGVALASIWKELGFFLIIFLAGLQNVPDELHEAAQIDGAGRLSRLLHITLPSIKPITGVAAVMAIIRGFQSFSAQIVLTGGSFGTEVLNLYIYKTAFASARMGRASAVAVMLFLVLLGLTLVQLRVFRRADR